MWNRGYPIKRENQTPSTVSKLLPTGRRYRPLAPYVVLGVSLVCALAAWVVLWKAVESRDQLRFQNAVLRTEHSVRNQLETYVAFMRAATALFAASDMVARNEFRTFVEQLDLKTRFPGVQAVGYAVSVPPDTQPAFVAEMRAQGFQDFEVWPDGDRDDAHVVTFLEPQDRRNRFALGYDLSSEPVRWAAMERARDSGLPAASEKVVLAPEIGGSEEAGFLIVAPVYHGPGVPSSIEERRARLAGFVYSPMRVGQMLADIVEDRRQRAVDVRIFDGRSTDPAALMYDSNPNPDLEALAARGLAMDRRLGVAGSVWTVIFLAGPDFDLTLEPWMLWSLLASGLAFSMLLWGVTRAQVAARLAAEDAAAGLRRSELALRASEAEAQAANRAKDAFLATLSHELRTPLNAILGWTSMLRGGTLDENRQRRALEVIERNATAQARLIEDLFDVARIISGKLRFEARPVEPALVLQAAVEAVRPLAESKGVELRVDVTPAIGVLSADPARLQQIVWNLMSNAIKFTSAGGWVELRLRAVDRYAEITVQDTGIGIAPDFLPHVFERFRQADSTPTRVHSGVGLGLTIVHHLVQLHGGTVHATSEGLGHGTTFTVRLPIALRPVRSAGETAAERREDALAGRRVLIVDLDATSRTLVAQTVAALGGDADGFETPAEAVASAAAAPPDFVVVDVDMPGVNAFELVRRLRSSGHPPVGIALSSDRRPRDREAYRIAGFAAHLSKPLDGDQLKAWLRTLAQSRGDQDLYDQHALGPG